jgi:hypothetical protein
VRHPRGSRQCQPIEVSRIEKIARKAVDEMTEYEIYSRLIKEGKAVAEIAATFGLGRRQVEQRPRNTHTTSHRDFEQRSRCDMRGARLCLPEHRATGTVATPVEG